MPALLMLPPAGSKPAEEWMASARRAAALDLLSLLSGLRGVGGVYVQAADPADREALASAGGETVEEGEAPFRFGHALAAFIAERGIDRLAYFGGSSAPLLSAAMLAEACSLISQGPKPVAVVNNLHSTDWIMLNHAQSVVRLAERLPTDNALGWVLEREAGYKVHALPACAASRADIDTPTDLLIMAEHPQLGPNLKAFLQRAPKDQLARIRDLRRVLGTPGSSLTIIGRSSSAVWSQLELQTEIWVRLFVEERGMVASGRLERGEVNSLVAQALEDLGPEAFVQRLAQMSDAVLWDTRVWMAHRGAWPSAADRYAADLGWADQVGDRALQRLTQEVNQASIPILTGGHGVVAGGTYALLESMPA